MKISILGAGRVGQAIGFLASRAGHQIVDVVCSSARSARRAANFIGSGRPIAASRAGLNPADLILISTPDDKISGASRLILESMPGIGHPVVLHTSGALTSVDLGDLKGAGLSVGSCHPLQSIQSGRLGVKLLKGSYFCVEGDGRAVRVARRLVKDLGGKVFSVENQKRVLYHAAAVLASGCVVGLLSISKELFERFGLGEEVLLSLVDGVMRNIKEVGVDEALTGPAIRGDFGTMLRHVQALKGCKEEWASIYVLLCERGLEIARGTGGVERLKAFLAERPTSRATERS
jgi:predicted short-subunit dehydrogenase-like oxidoreductase (DUF2520 family)